ncbi:hypothetical protein EGW08_017429 [Elysia chlorotica]|uniref:2Fe-2S ferredoxin-type domain-containing protein n=1 Tax=Elysia chlorotica TaxID=188477 RepID=A0A3S0ZH69_ELYCH|nr:hypothetical protein EGW08_017429 [Elysia chlorotica]
MASRRLASLLLNKTLSSVKSTAVTPLSALPCATWSRLHIQPRSGVSEKNFSSSAPKPQKQTVKVAFILRDGSRREVDATVGDNLLDIILEHDVDIDGFGACEGTLACSTCHLIFKQEDYDKLPSKPTDEELDMLDLAFGLEDTSRLGCQVIVTKDLDGMVVTVPQGVADARSGPL